MNIVVLSGGLDSTVCMALAAAEGPLLALSFDYGQRHQIELQRAAEVARHYGAEQLIVRLDASRWGGSALTDTGIEVPDYDATSDAAQIPVTYVPGRNLIFLAVAMGVAEARHADAVYLGVNALDYSGYPDCRPEFVRSFQQTAALALKRGVEGDPVELRTPLIDLAKAEIVKLGLAHSAPLELSWSCYRPGPRPCGRCDACALRAKGFAEAGVADPALY
ncbi:MAG TPA: 7-cyano-7-deazaguanine synthase QueC [Acidimicrobiales bacterium]|nr:7-cyano-7-deazaguanine synthase QueC [Acidimicrobiales bacterium]